MKEIKMKRVFVAIFLFVCVTGKFFFPVYGNQVGVNNDVPVLSSSLLTEEEKLHFSTLSRYIVRIFTSESIFSEYFKGKKRDESASDLEQTAAILIDNIDQSRTLLTQNERENLIEINHSIYQNLEKGNLEGMYMVFDQLLKRTKQRYDFIKSGIEQGQMEDQCEGDGELGSNHDFNHHYNIRAKTEKELQQRWLHSLACFKKSLLEVGLNQEEIIIAVKQQNERRLQRVMDFTTEQKFQSYIQTIFTQIDGYFRYYLSKNELNVGSVNVIGVGLILRREGLFVSVDKIIGGENGSSGLVAGDKIVAIKNDSSDFVSVVGWPIEDVVELLRGVENSKVSVRRLPSSSADLKSAEEFDLTRSHSMHKDSEQVSVRHVEFKNERFLIVTIPKFYVDWEAKYQSKKSDYVSTVNDIVSAYGELNDAETVNWIVDLRGNGGGALDEVLAVSSLFIGKNPVVQVKDQNNRVRAFEGTRDKLKFKSLTLLIDQNTASGAEIFAAALQDYGVALVVGQQSYGNGDIQSVIDLNYYKRFGSIESGSIKMTTSTFYRISGRGFYLNGVVPAVPLPVASQSDRKNKAVEKFRSRLALDIAPVEGYRSIDKDRQQQLKHRLEKILIKESELVSNYSHSEKLDQSIIVSMWLAHDLLQLVD